MGEEEGEGDERKKREGLGTDRRSWRGGGRRWAGWALTLSQKGFLFLFFVLHKSPKNAM